MTKYKIEVSDELTNNYFKSLINKIYKILPIKESGEPTLYKYIESLLRELIGNKTLIVKLSNDAQYLSLLATLEYLNSNDCEVAVVRTEVFKAISICKKLQKKYCVKGG